MILVILLAGIALWILGSYLYDNDHEGVGLAVGASGAVAFFASVVGAITLAVIVSHGSVITDELDMYIEENTAIETRIADVVDEYKRYELGVYGEITNSANQNDAMTVVLACPELNSSELVAEQIKVYNENNLKIKELREEQIELKVNRWWLYFGS